MLTFVIEALHLITNVQRVERILPWNKWIKQCVILSSFTTHFDFKATPIQFIDMNYNYNYVGLICNSMVCCGIWINSAHSAGMKSVICSALLCLTLLQFSYLHYSHYYFQTLYTYSLPYYCTLCNTQKYSCM